MGDDPNPPRRPIMDSAAAAAAAAGEEAAAADAGEEASAAAAWDWGALLDFTIDEDDPLILSWGTSASVDHQMPSPPPPPPDPAPLPPQPEQPAPSSSKVRKRDPRLVCANYLAGRVPCACPELDELEAEEAEEDEKEAASKRAKAGGVAPMRCQVPGCEVDIRELKGYHRRHRVCLHCANASFVVLDGEHKRYCQQCGKFHILPDFDEGKRSCRRKLERHNKRRRRRPTGGRNIVNKENDPQGDCSRVISCDSELRKDASNGVVGEALPSNKMMDREMLLESENGHGSPIYSLPSFENVQTGIVSFAASDGNQIVERTDIAKSAFSSILSDNKSIYSSVCPTDRISFKLYDWNPAEFPRRLRHQIFQWLASMPVELEGYIRPGCTILTIFIAMPQFMWEKLHDDVPLYVRDLVNAPESLLSGRGNFLIHLSNKVFQILKDGTSFVNIKMEVKAPRLHYVYPTYFEAGKPMEFFACGSNLDQPKFRFLVSFSGKYLVCDSCHCISNGKIRSYNGNVGNSVNDCEHEIFRISITQTDSEVLGPAFIEVENESGLSNFLPILFGNKLLCSELERMQETFSESLSASKVMNRIALSSASSGLCRHFVSKQVAISELLLDIAWLLKEPWLGTCDVILSSNNIKRITCLLNFAIKNELVSVLEVIERNLKSMTGWEGLDKSVNMTSNPDFRLLINYMSHAREILGRRTSHGLRSELNSRDSVHRLLMPHSYIKGEVICTVPWINQDLESRSGDGLVSTLTSSSQFDQENIPLVTKQLIRRQKYYPHLGIRWSQEGWPNIFPRKATSARLAVFVTVSVVMCFGACIALIHPQKAREFAVSIRRELFGGP